MSFWFQSSFELTGYITTRIVEDKYKYQEFQSSFELTGYITEKVLNKLSVDLVSKLFRAYRLYNLVKVILMSAI